MEFQLASKRDVLLHGSTQYMRSKSQIVAWLTDPGVIPVVRMDHACQVLPVCEALVAGGLTALEITLTIPDAFNVLREAVQKFGARATVGAGSVLNAEQARRAIDAGAEFLVSPIARAEIVAIGHAAGRAVVLGAYTPTEAQAVHELGADFVKLFPAEKLGPEYIRALRAPMPHLRIIPTGGVTLATVGDFLRAGCAALGVGSALITRKLVDDEDWAGLTRLAADFVKAAKDTPRKRATPG